MKRNLFFSLATILFFALFSCGSGDDQVQNEIKPEKLVEIKNGKYTEWYPGKKQIKFQGMIEKNGKRDGKWVYYSEKGTELSFTIYENGIKQGYTVVKYPNGAIRYRGEYKDDKIVGLWTTYDPKGKIISEKDYGYPAE
jgi:antitoxin component YwqK of YwqJK toxin-antitoxin module